MTEVQPPAPASPRALLQRICHPESIFRRAAGILELVAHSSVGLGEVLQDYAHQSCLQLNDFIRAAENSMQARGFPEDRETLAKAHFIVKAAKSVLEMTPAAMRRNKAEMLGDKEKLTPEKIGEATAAFLHSGDAVYLLGAEESGDIFGEIADAQVTAMPEPLRAAGQ